MTYIVSITSQGQITIPMELRKKMGLTEGGKALLTAKGKTFVVEPKLNFWDLSGSLKSKVRLTDAQLKKAREGFSTSWAKE